MLSSKSMPAEIKFVFVRAQHYPAFMIITASSRSIVLRENPADRSREVETTMIRISLRRVNQ